MTAPSTYPVSNIEQITTTAPTLCGAATSSAAATEVATPLMVRTPLGISSM